MTEILKFKFCELFSSYVFFPRYYVRQCEVVMRYVVVVIAILRRTNHVEVL